MEAISQSRFAVPQSPVCEVNRLSLIVLALFAGLMWMLLALVSAPGWIRSRAGALAGRQMYPGVVVPQLPQG